MKTIAVALSLVTFSLFCLGSNTQALQLGADRACNSLVQNEIPRCLSEIDFNLLMLDNDLVALKTNSSDSATQHTQTALDTPPPRSTEGQSEIRRRIERLETIVRRLQTSGAATEDEIRILRSEIARIRRRLRALERNIAPTRRPSHVNPHPLMEGVFEYQRGVEAPRLLYITLQISGNHQMIGIEAYPNILGRTGRISGSHYCSNPRSCGTGPLQLNLDDDFRLRVVGQGGNIAHYRRFQGRFPMGIYQTAGNGFSNAPACLQVDNLVDRSGFERMSFVLRTQAGSLANFPTCDYRLGVCFGIRGNSRYTVFRGQNAFYLVPNDSRSVPQKYEYLRRFW